MPRTKKQSTEAAVREIRRRKVVGPQGLEPWTDGLKEHDDPEE